MIKFSLYENAIDSINHGLDHLKLGIDNDSKRDFKQSILLFFQGTEVLLKELLCQINPMYIFDKNSLFDRCIDPLNPTLDELYNCKSIEINKLCKAVLKFYSNDFSKNSLNIVEKLAKERNKIQHFCIEIEVENLQSLILQLYHNVLSPALKIIGKNIIEGNIKDNLNEKLDKIFCFTEVADKEEQFLKLSGVDFHRGTCFKCGNYSSFIFYDGSSYPTRFYCSSCGFKNDSIGIDEYRECPECGAVTLIYDSELDGGICLWYKCANHKDGGILIDMDYCDKCHDYIIEGKCGCTLYEDE